MNQDKPYSICLGFDFPGTFFDSTTLLEYEGRELEVLRGEDWESHAVRCRLSTESEYKDAFKTLARFLNELSWHYRFQIETQTCVTGTGIVTSTAVSSLQKHDKHLIHDFVQTVFDSTQHLALGFWREGFCSNSPFYTFISYYKLLDIPFAQGTGKGHWVIDALSKIKSPGAKATCERMRLNGITDIADWLFREGRNALVHANLNKNEPIVDVAEFDHWQDIVWANQILSELVEMIMIEKLDIPLARKSR